MRAPWGRDTRLLGEKSLRANIVPSKLLRWTTEGGGLAKENALVGDAGFHGMQNAVLRRRHPLGCAVLAGIRAAEGKPDPQAEGYRKGHPSPDAQHEEYVSLVTEEFPSLNPALNQCQVVSTLLPSIA